MVAPTACAGMRVHPHGDISDRVVCSCRISEDLHTRTSGSQSQKLLCQKCTGFSTRLALVGLDQFAL